MRKETGDASQPAGTKIIKPSESCAEPSAAVPSLRNLISQAQPRRYVSISCLGKRSAARREGYRRRVVESHDGERIVRRVLTLYGRIDVPPQAISQCQSRRDLPGVLAVQGEVL